MDFSLTSRDFSSRTEAQIIIFKKTREFWQWLLKSLRQRYNSTFIKPVEQYWLTGDTAYSLAGVWAGLGERKACWGRMRRANSGYQQVVEEQRGEQHRRHGSQTHRTPGILQQQQKETVDLRVGKEKIFNPSERVVVLHTTCCFRWYSCLLLSTSSSYEIRKKH